MAKLESLIVDMQLETAELRKGLEQVKHHMKEAGEAAEGLLNFEVLKEVGHFAFEAAEKLADFALKGGEVADKMGKMAQAANVPVESFSKLAYAANLSKVSSEDLGVAFKKLNVNLAEAATGSGKQASLFRALGVSVKDASGETRKADDVMADLAQAFSEMQEGPAKAALAVEVFGKAGAGMLPFLNDGREGLKKLGDEADKFGVTLNGEAVKAATEFNDNIEKMKAVVGGVATRVAGELAPAMAELTSQLLNSKSAGDGFKETGTIIATVLRGIATAVVYTIGKFREFGTGLAGLASISANLITGNLEGAMEASKAYQEDQLHIQEQTADQLTAIWKETAKEMVLPEMDFTKTKDPTKILQKVKDGAKDATKEIQALSRALEEMTEKLLLAYNKNEQDLKKKVYDITSKSGEEQRSYNAIGQSPSAAFAEATSGFKDFNDALKQSTFFSIAREEELKKAADLEIEGKIDLANAARDNAEAFDGMAKQADVAKGAFRGMAETVDKLHKSMSKTVGGQIGLGFAGMFGNNTPEGLQAAGAVGGSIAGSMGKAGSVLNSAAQGAEVGGIWGALIAAIAEIVKDSEGFQKVIHAFDRDLKQLGDAIGGMFDPIGELVDAIQPLTTAISEIIKAFVGIMNQLHGAGQVGDVLKPIMNAIMKIIDPIMKIIKSLSDMISSSGIFDAIIKIITPIFDMIGNVISSILGPVVNGLGNAFKMIGDVLAPIINLIGTIGTMIGAFLAPLQGVFAFIDMIGKLVGQIINGMSGMSLGIKIFSTIINGVALLLLGISDGIMRVWEGVTKGFRDMFASISAALGGNADLDKIALEFSKMNVDASNKIKEIEKQIDETAQAVKETWDPNAKPHSASAVVHPDKTFRPSKEFIDSLKGLTFATDKAKEGIDRMNGALTNVPDGFKVALRRLQVQATEATRDVTGGNNVNVTVQGTIIAQKDLADLMEKLRARKSYRQTGRSLPAGG